jgi:hypothetical protein
MKMAILKISIQLFFKNANKNINVVNYALVKTGVYVKK